MSITPTLRSVAARTDESHWGQSLLLPHTYGVVEVEDPEGRAMQQGVSLLSSLTHALDTPPQSLDMLTTLVATNENHRTKTIIVMSLVGAELWIVLRGSGAVYLKRDGKLACLLTGSGSIAGSVRVGDVVWLGSAGAIAAFSAAEIAGLIDDAAPADIAERMTVAWHERDTGIGGAALIFRIGYADEGNLAALPADLDDTRNASETAQPPADTDQLSESTGPRHSWFARLSHGIGRVLQFISSSNKKMAIVTALFFLFFGVSVVLGLYRQATNTKARAVAVAVTDAQRLYDEGIALMELNPVKGRERLSQAKATLDPLTKTVSAGSPEGRSLAALYKEVDTALTGALRVTHVTPSVFFDVGLIKKGSTATTFGLDKDLLGVVDSRTKTVYAVTLSSKNGRVIAGGDQFANASLVTVFGDTVYVLVDGGIHAIDIQAQKVAPLVVRKTDDWGSIAGLVAYGGNLYLLDTQKSRIWKYVATEKGFSDIREYLNADTLPNLSQAVGMAIDGSVWLGSHGVGLTRFTQGRDNTFVPKGVDPALGTNLLVYASDDVTHIYVADLDHQRVVVLDKDGVYSAQYVWEASFAPTAFVVSEAQKKILFLAGGTIYSIDL